MAGIRTHYEDEPPYVLDKPIGVELNELSVGMVVEVKHWRDVMRGLVLGTFRGRYDGRPVTKVDFLSLSNGIGADSGTVESFFAFDIGLVRFDHRYEGEGWNPYSYVEIDEDQSLPTDAVKTEEGLVPIWDRFSVHPMLPETAAAVSRIFEVDLETLPLDHMVGAHYSREAPVLIGVAANAIRNAATQL